MERSPLDILGAIVDEIDGVRRFDARSHLPEALMREARYAVEVPITARDGSTAPNRLEDLVGRTVEHVFDVELRRGHALILCTDGTFVALEASDDGISEMTYYKKLTDYLDDRELVEIGAMTQAEADERKRQAKDEALENARAALKRAQRDADEAEAEVARLQRAG